MYILEFYPSSADLIRDRFGTIFESKRLPPKEFTPNIDNSSLALDTTLENTLHSYFMFADGAIGTIAFCIKISQLLRF